MKFSLFVLSCIFFGSVAFSRPPIIDDSKILREFQEKSGIYAIKESTTSVAELQKGLVKPVGIAEISRSKAPDSALESVFVVGAFYDCGKCDKWHPSSLATAWVMASDGVFCTNYHVIAGFKGEVMAVSSWDGEVFPVTEILLADKANDIAVFRVETTGLVPLPLAEEAAAVGDKISCLSHPDRRFFHHSFGEVARYHMKRARNSRVPQMSITADFAKGSSGGPILNEDNEVVGMVSSTSNIYSKRPGNQDEKNLQMVLKNCVPGFVIQELLEEVKTKEIVGDKSTDASSINGES